MRVLERDSTQLQILGGPPSDLPISATTRASAIPAFRSLRLLHRLNRVQRVRAALILVAAAILGCNHYRPPEGLRPEEAVHVRFTRDESDMMEIAFGFGLRVAIYAFAEGCPERGFLGSHDMSKGRHLGNLNRLSRGQSEEVDLPASRTIFFDLRESEGGPGFSVSCDLLVGWSPLPGHRYEFRYTTNGAMCNVTGMDTTSSAEVSLFSPAGCRVQAGPLG
jgi:hypothetical protein